MTFHPDTTQAAIDEAKAERKAHEKNALFLPMTEEEKQEAEHVIKRLVLSVYGELMQAANKRENLTDPVPDGDGKRVNDPVIFANAADAIAFALAHAVDAIQTIPARAAKGRYVQAGIAVGAVASLIGSAGSDIVPRDENKTRVDALTTLFEGYLKHQIKHAYAIENIIN